MFRSEGGAKHRGANHLGAEQNRCEPSRIHVYYPNHLSRLPVATSCIECVQDFQSVFWLYSEEGIPLIVLAPMHEKMLELFSRVTRGNEDFCLTMGF